MTTIEKIIVKFIDDTFGFPYLYYDKDEQTWYNEFFLYDIKKETMYCSDIVKSTLYKKYGKGYIEQVLVIVLDAWFKKSYKLSVKHVD